jgi:hypothetical protein
MRGMGDESAVGPAGSPSAASEVPATRRRDASSHYEGRGPKGLALECGEPPAAHSAMIRAIVALKLTF